MSSLDPLLDGTPQDDTDEGFTVALHADTTVEDQTSPSPQTPAPAVRDQRRRARDGEAPAESMPLDLAQVVVSVGTDHHRFDRLIGWIDEWRELNPGITVLVQRGTSVQSRRGDCHELIPHAELLERFASAAAVVSHGGPSTVMDARMSGRFPIVMARNPAYEEHVDDHQMRFAEHLRKHNVADVVDTKVGLFEALDRALTNPAAYTIPISDDAADGIHEFGRLVDGLVDGLMDG